MEEYVVVQYLAAYKEEVGIFFFYALEGLPEGILHITGFVFLWTCIWQ